MRLWPCALLVLLACHDAGQDTLARVKGQYTALLQAGTPAQSRDFDALLKELDSIPKSSRARAGADELVRAIAAARGGVVERPLAVASPVPPVGPEAVQRELTQTRAECERLAKELSGVEGEARTGKLELLDACRRRADTLADALVHGHDDGGTK